MRRQFNTDCEGPVSKNDNAFELSQKFIPQGGELFAKLSKYDDFLADIVKKPGYKAGDTLRLILPFLKAYGVTDDGIREFSSQNILLVPKADIALKYIESIMPTFIISTSYRPYINALCQMIDFPIQNTYCTEMAIDKYQIPEAEIRRLKDLHDEILTLPPVEFPASAASREDLDERSVVCVDRLDEIFWEELPNMKSGKLLEDVNPTGGFEKAEAIKKSCKRTRIKLADVMYVGDSITDTEAMGLVKDAGGVAVSFNGNRYAIRSADIACISPNAMILAFLAFTFKEYGIESILYLASEWKSEKATLKKQTGRDMPDFFAEDTDLYLIEDSDMEALVSRSESFRKQVRGERIGRLG